MRKLLFFFVLAIPFTVFSQIGVKGGINFANVSNASSINESSRSGFNIGVFISPPSKSILSSRTELLFSRQGYNYKTSTNTGNVNLDYIMLPQLLAINLTKLLQVQLGAQMAYLINAKVDSSGSGSSNPYGVAIMDYYNRFDYGFGIGAEVHPFKGLLFGVKYNISLGKLYNDAYSGRMPNFASIDAKNNLVQVFTGWRFGK
ncbi:MAG: porin family protein [Candidatus Dadabacteria bacterium]